MVYYQSTLTDVLPVGVDISSFSVIIVKDVHQGRVDMFDWRIESKKTDDGKDILRIDLYVNNRLIASALRMGIAFGVKNQTVRGAKYKIVEYPLKENDYPVYAKNEKYAEIALVTLLQSYGMGLFLDAKVRLRELTKRKKESTDD